MNIHEYHAKEILKKYGAQIPNGIVVFNTDVLNIDFKNLIGQFKFIYFVLDFQ